MQYARWRRHSSARLKAAVSCRIFDEVRNVADGAFRVRLATLAEVENYLEDNDCFVITAADLSHPQIDDGELPF